MFEGDLEGRWAEEDCFFGIGEDEGEVEEEI